MCPVDTHFEDALIVDDNEKIIKHLRYVNASNMIAIENLEYQNSKLKEENKHLRAELMRAAYHLTIEDNPFS